MFLFNACDIVGARFLWMLGFPLPLAKKPAEEPLDMSERKEKKQQR